MDRSEYEEKAKKFVIKIQQKLTNIRVLKSQLQKEEDELYEIEKEYEELLKQFKSGG